MNITNNNIIPFRLERTSKNEWIIPGSSLLSDVTGLLNIEFQPRGRYKTIAGFIMTELGIIPNEGDQLRKYGYTFTVLTRDRLRIIDVRIVKNPIENTNRI